MLPRRAGPRLLQNFSRRFACIDSQKIIVQKFGGTSLGSGEKLEKVVNIVRQFNEEARLITVVSAFSRENKAEGTTSLLLEAARAAVLEDDYLQYLDKVEDNHIDIIYEKIDDKKLRQQLRTFIGNELKAVKRFCDCLKIIREISPRSHDLIIGCGERLAAGVLTGIFQSEGFEAEYVNLSKAFPNGLNPQKKGYQHTAKRTLKQVLTPILVKPKTIPVVTGFFGDVDGGIIEGVGRGYTDLTSTLVAGAVGAQALQVWKESDGVFTGNPTKIESARLLSYITPREAKELTHFGNEVLHPFTMACAIEDNTPIYILNTFKPESGGTFISSTPPKEVQEDLTHNVTAVCSKKHITLLAVKSNAMLEPTAFLNKIFDCFHKHGVRIDLMSTTVTECSLTINESVSEIQIDELIEELLDTGFCTVDKIPDRAIISCIGEKMRGVRGLAGRLFASLGKHDVNCDMITQSVEEVNVSIVVDQNQSETAIKAVHAEFLEDEPVAI